jgi:protein-disulfide isomerase
MATRPKETKAQSRERLREERARQAAAEKRRAVVGFLVVHSRASQTVTSGAVPKGVTATKGYPFGSVSKPVLDVWEDFQCPNCAAFEAANKTKIEELVSSGKAQVVYHTWNFLDAGNANNPQSTQQSSTRAAIAAACAWDQGKFLQMHDQIFANQPAVEGTGWTDDRLEQLAKDAGVPDTNAFNTCLSDRTYAGFATQVAAQADKQQITGTPTFLVDGQIVDTSSAATWQQRGDLVVAAVDKAAGTS